ncbi:modin [Fusarium sp. NRRL 52700]|nr:modin [Fusarium sp. NRRL 52700]
MITTLLAIIAIIVALNALTRLTCFFYIVTAPKRESPAASRVKSVIGTPENDTNSPTIFVGLEDHTADSGNGRLVSNIVDAQSGDDRHRQAARAGLSDEAASWTGLLEQCRKIESDSQNWERLSWRVQCGTNQPDIQGNAVLTVGAQTNSGKPQLSMDSKMTRSTFAITSMRHIIELAAFFGLHWISFDSHRRCFAEGNGFTLDGVREEGTGFVFQFQRIGPSLSVERIIPTLAIRELCFGAIPTFYRAVESNQTYIVPLQTPRSLETLRLGTRDKVAETLSTIGCNGRSIRAYLREEEDMQLFPAEEAQNLPTEGRVSQELCRLYKIVSRLNSQLPQGRGHSLGPIHQNELHHALDELDVTLKAYPKTLVLDVLRCHLEEILQTGIRLDGNSTDELGFFSDIAFASRDVLEQEFMERYFRVVRHRAVARETNRASDVMERNAVWCAMVLRMICWLSLHNFHKDDILAPDYGLERSNTLAYITALPDRSGLFD